MFKFTRTGIFCLLIIMIFCLIQIFINQYSIKSEMNQDIMKLNVMEEKPVIENTDNIEIWKIEIPKISLIAHISEGTSKEILNQYVGHFVNTSPKEGNIGLAAHNKDLKLLKEGDGIKYKYNEFEKTYEVIKCRIIKETEWEYLEETEENMLTLITFIENQPEYRRCIQATEKEEEIY